jgi:murein DD-endopeptidase MepM/ murein hydrolase activator NlpD
VSRRLLFVCLLALALLSVSSAAGDVGIGQRKEAIDAKIGRLQEQIADARARESRLSKEIAGVTSQIRTLEAQVGDVSSRLALLQNDLALHQRRLDKLDELFGLQTRRFDFLKSEYKATVARLSARLVEIYENGEPTTVDVVVNAHSIQDILDQLNYLGAVIRQNKQIAAEVGTAKEEVRRARAQTRTARTHLRAEQRVIQVRAEQVQAARDQLLASRNRLAGARAQKRHALAVTQESEKDFVGEADALAAASARLEAQLKAEQSGPSAYTPPAGSNGSMIWPVSGPVTSPFGERWGRMHEGIDIGVPTGTPIHAAAAGRVVYCGWEEGYGNFVVIDHGNGVATAYGHQSSIAVSCGEDVSQGQVIGYSGSTGHSTGPHLHFEVRVNGAPVDPLGYL